MAALPCFNTESSIGGVVSRARRHVSQVIVIDDGSLDNTACVAESAGAQVVRHGINKGYGEAIKSCLEAARTGDADILVILDGDGQHDPDEIPLLIAPIVRHEAALVIGSRFLDRTVKVPPYRRFGINVITSIWNLGSRIRVTDAQSGFRAYSREVLRGISICERGMGASIEILEKARRKGFLMKEVPISCFYPPSTFGSRSVRHGLGVAFDVLRIRLNRGAAECQ